MSILRSQRGEGKAGCLLWVLVLCFGVLVASRVVPVKMAVMQLEDHIQGISERHPRSTRRQVIDSIYKRSKELRLPIKKKDIEVMKNLNRMIVDITFTVPLDFEFHEYNWEIEIHFDRPIFII